jgi:NAD(P)-dependent dehydrogenase (short-subunit alcohol dehydrogenase family)
MASPNSSLTGRRVFITGAARGIGAALAERLHRRGARVAIAGLEPDLLAATAERAGAPWWTCDVADRTRVDEVVAEAAASLGGLDVVVANAGVAAQLPLVGGDPAIFEQINRVNVLGAYYTLRAAGGPFRAVAQPVVDRALRGRVADVLAIARDEQVELTTTQSAS